MDGNEYMWLVPLIAFLVPAIGWGFREYWQRRNAKRQAAGDASKILSEKKKLLEEMISGTKKVKHKKELKAQLAAVNAALLGLHSERLRRTLKDAGFPHEEALIADGLSQLQPQQVRELREEIAAVENLPPFDSTQELLTLATAYYYAGQYKDTKDIYDRILNLNPNDPSALMNRGVIYWQLGRYDDALADLNRSLEIRPDDPLTLSNRSVAYIKLGRYDNALADLNRSLEIRPDDPLTLHNRGAAYIHRGGRYDDALADLNRSLEIRSDDPATLNDRGVAYIKLGRYDDALADLNRSLKIRSDDAYMPYNLACLFSLWGKAEKSINYLKKAISMDKKCREDAKTDEDFDNIRKDPRFKKLVKSD